MAQSSPDRPGRASVTRPAAALPTSALLGRGERGAGNEKLSQQMQHHGVRPAGYGPVVMQDAGWPARMARLVAGEVRRYRERQQPRMSARQLSDRTGELGMLIPRSVLANLESGRRENVSVAEIVVLAAALNVSPIELMCPGRLRPPGGDTSGPPGGLAGDDALDYR